MWLKLWWLRVLNRLNIRKDTMTCMRVDETWNWPDNLGKRTLGECSECHEPIYFEKQNKRYDDFISQTRLW